MRFYAEGKSKMGFGYIPCWVNWHYKENGKEYRFTLDLNGDVDFASNGFSCRVKGESSPWELIDIADDIVLDLYQEENKEIYESFTNLRLKDILEKAYDFNVGVYISNDEITNEELKSEKLTDCEGSLELWLDDDTLYIKNFAFETELV